MAYPNLEQELDDHIFDNLTATYGPNASDPDKKNKYSITRDYRNQINEQELRSMVEARVGTTKGAFIIGTTRINFTSRSMTHQKYEVTIEMIMYFGSTNVKKQQLKSGNRTVYEMRRSFLEVFAKNPISLTGNPIVGFRLIDGDVTFVNEEVDACQQLLSVTATLKNV